MAGEHSTAHKETPIPLRVRRRVTSIGPRLERLERQPEMAYRLASKRQRRGCRRQHCREGGDGLAAGELVRKCAEIGSKEGLPALPRSILLTNRRRNFPGRRSPERGSRALSQSRKTSMLARSALTPKRCRRVACQVMRGRNEPRDSPIQTRRRSAGSRPRRATAAI